MSTTTINLDTATINTYVGNDIKTVTTVNGDFTFTIAGNPTFTGNRALNYTLMFVITYDIVGPCCMGILLVYMQGNIVKGACLFGQGLTANGGTTTAMVNVSYDNNIISIATSRGSGTTVYISKPIIF